MLHTELGSYPSLGNVFFLPPFYHSPTKLAPENFTIALRAH
jgi:hypothetical protein